MEGEYKFLSIMETSEGEIVIRKDSEILIPACFRESLKEKMHKGHLSDIYMLNFGRG